MRYLHASNVYGSECSLAIGDLPHTLVTRRVLQKHQQLVTFSLCSTLQRRLYVSITLVLFRWLAVSIIEKCLSCRYELLNSADSHFCYVIKMLVHLTSSSKCANMCDSFTSSNGPYYKFISCYFILWQEPCICSTGH